MAFCDTFVHQDSELLALLGMHSSGFSAGILGGSGKLPSLGATPPQRNKSQRATTHQVASRFASDPARSKGVRFCLRFERHSRGGRLNAKNAFLKSRLIDPGFHCTFIRTLNFWHFSLCTHQESQLLALLIMLSSGFSAPGTSLYAFSRILSSWHLSLSIHQDSQLLALPI